MADNSNSDSDEEVEIPKKSETFKDKKDVKEKKKIVMTDERLEKLKLARAKALEVMRAKKKIKEKEIELKKKEIEEKHTKKLEKKL